MMITLFKKILIISSFLPLTSWAAETPFFYTTEQANPVEVAMPCFDCTDASYTSKVLQEEQQKIGTESMATQISEVSKKMRWGEACDKFTSDGEFGKWSGIIEQELVRGENNALIQGSSDLRALCPGYDALDLEERQNVWVLIVNAMAFYESSCNQTSHAQGPNGPLIGLLQLHRGDEDFYAPNCRRGDGNTPSGTFRCGLSMLNSQLMRQEPLFSTRSYWDVLRPQGNSKKAQKIEQAIRSLPFCYNYEI